MLTFADLMAIMTEEHCLDFLRTEADAAVGEIISRCVGASRLLTPEAEAIIAEQYYSRLCLPYCHTLVLKIQEAARAYDVSEGLTLRGDNPAALRKAASDVRRDLGSNPAQTLRRENPLLGECVDPMRLNFIASQIEMLRDLGRYKSEIESTLLGGRAFTRINAFSGDSGDMHRHGRVVRRVSTDAGAFFYKPHDCRTELLYGEIVRRWFSDCTLAPRLVCGEGCGFVEEMKAEPLFEGQTPGEYFHNFGTLTALFHGLGAGDMHQENILACGVYPTAVDLETIFRAKFGKTESDGERRRKYLTPLQRDMMNTVSNISVLPVWVYKMGMHSALYHSRSNDGVACLPVLDGREYTVSGYERAFAEGFGTGYGRMLAHRGEILRLAGQYGDIPIRHVMNNTGYYYIVRRELFRHDCMVDRTSRQRVLDKLNAPYTEKGRTAPRGIIDYEQRCLLQGDIPYYCSRADGRTLCGENCSEPIFPDYFEKSALEALTERLSRLSGEEQRFEEQWILASLRHAPLDEEKAACSAQKAERPLTAEEARGLLCEMLEELAEDRVEGCRGEPVWFSVSRMIWQDSDCGVVNRMADAASFCATARTADLPEALYPLTEEIIRGFLSEMRLSLDCWGRESPAVLQHVLPLNGRTGLGALLHTLHTLAEGGVPDAETLLNDLLQLTDSQTLFHDSVKTGGEAGLLLALSELKPARLRDPAAWERCVRGCAESLRSCAPFSRLEDDARAALAMGKAYELTGSAGYLDPATEVWARVRDAYLAGRGWHNAYTENWLSPVGNNTALIGLYALAAGKLSGDVRELALRAQMEETGLRLNDTLTEGNAMAALFLIRSAAALNRPELLDEAGRILGGMRARQKREGGFRCTPDGIRSSFDAALWRGTLGIGYAAAAWLGAAEKEERHEKD